MKKDLSVIILDIHGKEIKDNDGPISLAKMVIYCLTVMPVDERSEGHEKFKRYQIAQKIVANEKECELTHEEVTKIKELVGKIQTPAVVGFVYDYFEEKLTNVKK